MGGFGSGKETRRKAWRSKKRYIISLPEMPVSKLIHAHRGDPNNQFVLGKLKCKIHPSSIHLEHDEKLPLDVSEIEISAFPCNYGGYRYYGRCPACNRCVRSLYVLDGTIPVCRLCLKMVYSSQNATFSYRLYKKLRSSKNKLNNDEWTKPKWMREKTFEQLREKIFELDEKREITLFFSLRNHRSVNRIFDKYGSAIDETALPSICEWDEELDDTSCSR